MRKLLAGLLALLLILPGPASAEESSDALVTAGDRVVYTIYDGEALMAASLAAIGNRKLTREEAVSLRDGIADELCNQAALTLKYEEYGLNNENPEEQKILDYNAEAAWNQAISEMAAQLRDIYGGSEEDSIETAKALMKQTGYSIDSMREQVRSRWRSKRLAKAVFGEVMVSDEEIGLLYQEQYVKPDQQAYEEDIPAFEEKVLFGSEQSCYIPGGYRMVQWILLPYGKRAGEEMQAAYAARDKAYRLTSDTYEKTFGTFESDEARARANAAYDAALAEYGAACEALNTQKQARIAEYEELIKKILAEYHTGENWEKLIETYSGDLSCIGNPYPVHEKSMRTDPDLLAAAMSIYEEGGVADPVAGRDGILLIRREKDPESGAAPLSAEQREMLRDSLTEQKEGNLIQESLPAWREEYGIRSYPERLTVPGENGKNTEAGTD